MTTKAQLQNAGALNLQLDQVNAALTLVARGNFTCVVELCATDYAALRVTADLPVGILTSQLTARQKVLQDALTALGVN